MSTNVVIPKHDGSFTDVLIVLWVRPDGARVRTDEPIVEYEGGGQTYTLHAPADGILHILVEEGQIVPVESVVGKIV